MRLLVAAGLPSRLSGYAPLAPRRRASLSILVGSVGALDSRDLVEAHGDASRQRPLLPRRPASQRRPSPGCCQRGGARRRGLAGGTAMVDAGRRAGVATMGDRRRRRGGPLVDLPRDVLGGDLPASHAPPCPMVPHEA